LKISKKYYTLTVVVVHLTKREDRMNILNNRFNMLLVLKAALLILVSHLVSTQPSFSQTVGELSLGGLRGMGMTGTEISEGRSAGNIIDFTSYNQLQKIRGYINKGKNEKAAIRAIRMIEQMESGRNTGLQKSKYYGFAYNELCVSTTNLRKVEYAMDACNKALTIFPENWESLKSRATLYFMTEDYSNSLADFKKSLEYSPDNNGINTALNRNISTVENKLN